jgi:Protein of unknown function (DUF3445)
MFNPDLPSALNLEGLFTGSGYRFSMGLKRISPEKFFRNLHGTEGQPEDSEVENLATAERPEKSGAKKNELLAARRAILTVGSDNYVCEPLNPADAAAVRRFASTWVTLPEGKTFRKIGMDWEPDFVLLSRGAADEVLGGCVCFPTGWSLPDKQSQHLSAVHSPVPGLNRDLAVKIDSMLKALRNGDCYQRTNWGLSSSSDLNQHPSQCVPEIVADFNPSTTWLRIEWQVLIALDEARLLFGIRIFHVSLESIRKNEQASALLAGNLLAMPNEMIRYKRLESCCAALISFLTAH